VADPRYPEEVEAMLVNYLSLPPFQGHWGEPSVRRELEIANVAIQINRIIRETLINEKDAQASANLLDKREEAIILSKASIKRYTN
jgi:hypothetical protein